jgi:protein-arginine kinase activator protein McsA
MESMYDEKHVEIVDEEDILIAEMARLIALLSSYEETEQYDKAAIVHNKIKSLQDKINKLYE